jgi:hypothetical protein
MKRRLIVATLAAAVLVGPAQTQEDPGSGNYMLPLCKTWLRMMSNDRDIIMNEMRAGNAKPGGIVMYFMQAGMCAGEVIGISEVLGAKACIPNGVTNEQLVRVVVAFVEEHPADIHENFSVLAGVAMVSAWPCHK